MSVEEAKCLTTQIGGGGLGIKLLLKKFLPNPPSLDLPSTPISRGAVLPSHSFFRESVCQSTFLTADSEFCFLISAEISTCLFAFQIPKVRCDFLLSHSPLLSSVEVSERCQEKGMPEAVPLATFIWTPPCN